MIANDDADLCSTYTRYLAAIIAIVTVFAVPLMGESWTSPLGMRVRYEDPATRETWYVEPLSALNPSVSPNARAACVFDRSGRERLDSLPETLEHISFETPLRPADAKKLCRLPRLRSVMIGSADPDVIHALTGVPCLTSINISGIMTEAVANQLCSLDRIDTLSLFGATDAKPIAILAQSSSVTKLSLYLTSWSDEVVRAVSAWTTLEVLSLGGGRPLTRLPRDPPSPIPDTENKVSAASWESLDKLARLLEYRDSSPPALSGSAVAKIVKGKRIRVYDSTTPLSNEEFTIVASSTHLQYISASLGSSCQLKAYDAGDALSKATKLTSVRLINVPPSWSGLSKLTRLTEAVIQFVNIPSKDLGKQMSALPPEIIRLELGDWLGSDSIRMLASWNGASSCKALKLRVRISRGDDLRLILHDLAKFTALEELDLDIRGPAVADDLSPGVSDIEARVWEPIGRISGLVSLRLNVGQPGVLGDDLLVKRLARDYYSFDRAALRHVLNHPVLRSLDLQNQTIKPGALEDVRTAGVRSLLLDNVRGIGAADVDAIVESKLAVISLHGTRVELSTSQVQKVVSYEGREVVSLEAVLLKDPVSAKKVISDRKTDCVVFAD